MESAVVLGLIILGALVAVQTLSRSTKQGFQSVTQSMVTPGASTVAARLAADKTEVGASASVEALLSSHQSATRRSDIAIIVCVSCMIVIGGLYLRLWRKRTGDLREHEEATRKYQERSTALRQVLSKRNSIFSRIDDNWETILNGHAIVETYMSSNVVSVDPLMTKDQALQRMQTQGFRRFMVQRTDGSFAGVVSRKDILSNPGERVCDVMTCNARIATPETEIQTALSILLENRISCLPVVKGKTLVGLLSVSDLLMVLQCLLRDLSTRNLDASYIGSQAHHDRCEVMLETSDESPSKIS